jgi:hypothetical protein
MKPRFSSLLLLVALTVSCGDPGIDKSDDSKKLVRESYYAFDTGELLKEIVYAFDRAGNLVTESETDARNGSSWLKSYQYDEDGMPEKVVTEYSDGFSTTTTYVYEDGLKKVEEKEESFGIYRQLFYYTGITLDSVEGYLIYPHSTQPYLMNTKVFTYENGRLTKELFKAHIDTVEGPKTLTWEGNHYTYQDGLLQSKCFGEYDCTKYFYDGASRLVTITQWLDGEDRVTEELRYEGDLLTEKTLHHYTVYDVEGFIGKTLVKYSYK